MPACTAKKMVLMMELKVDVLTSPNKSTSKTQIKVFG
jgi:hypothetical protein